MRTITDNFGPCFRDPILCESTKERIYESQRRVLEAVKTALHPNYGDLTVNMKKEVKRQIADVERLFDHYIG